METSIKNRHKRKLQRDNVNAVIAGKNQRKNRRFSRNQLERKKREKKKRNKCSFKERIKKIKENCPDQNAINLSTRDLTPSQKSVLAKGPTFAPTPTSVNWLGLRKDFVNQLKYEFKKQRTQHQEQGISANNEPQSLQYQISNKDENNNLPPPPVKTSKFARLYRSKETDNKSVEVFIKKIEKDLFNTENV